jgi:DNA-binding transcriptional LysR family regulator
MSAACDSAELDEAERGRRRKRPSARHHPAHHLDQFGTHQVTPAIALFLARHPQVKFDVSLSDGSSTSSSFDLAIGSAGQARRPRRAQAWRDASSGLCRARLHCQARRAGRAGRPRAA